ncbi:MAG: GNAT family N-acetyltransferase [Wenzhouxiangellaceae bacterium]|nr:GNAT family N-acetyltransferase [Wenzhouxiangellaceae bacterium]
MEIEIRDNRDENRFETVVDGHRCVLDYRIDGNVITIPRVLVPPPVEGRGIAGKLTRHALDFSRDKGLSVVPKCPYVAAWIRRHPEYEDLVARD